MPGKDGFIGQFFALSAGVKLLLVLTYHNNHWWVSAALIVRNHGGMTSQEATYSILDGKCPPPRFAIWWRRLFMDKVTIIAEQLEITEPALSNEAEFP